MELCPKCLLLAGADPQLGALENSWGVPTIPVFSLGRYGGALRQIILRAKHQDGRDLGPFLFQAGANLSTAMAPLLEDAREILVVSAPPSWKRRWDGQVVTDQIARGVCSGLSAQLPDCSISVEDLFKLKPWKPSQSSRSGSARRKGRQGAFSLVGKVSPGVVVVLVDDVLTTGATMREMWRHLGKHVQVIAVLATA